MDIKSDLHHVVKIREKGWLGHSAHESYHLWPSLATIHSHIDRKRQNDVQESC